MRAKRAGMTLGGGCLAAALLAAFLQKGEGSFLPALLLAVSGVLLVLFAGFERSRAGAQAVVLIALLSAVSCAGRVLFAGLPSVQPSSSLIILTGIVFGPQAGFMTGAMTALTSNMAAWGMMGLSSGLLQRLLKRHGLLLSLYGCVWGFLFGWFMNLWTVSGGFFGPFSLRAVVAACAASLPLDLAHAACNLLLLLLFEKPFLRKMERIAVKYGLKQQI